MEIKNPFLSIFLLFLISVVVVTATHATLVGFLVLGFKPLEMLFKNNFNNSPIWQYVAANLIIMASSSFVRATFEPKAELSYGENGFSMNLEAFFTLSYLLQALYYVVKLFFGYLLPNL